MVNPCSKSWHIHFITVLNEKSKVRRQGFFFCQKRVQRFCFNFLFSHPFISVLTSCCGKTRWLWLSC